jgi:mannose-6-phosphate isomerase-like protein (cupin superfamily)
MKKMLHILTPVLFLFLFLFHVPACAQDSSNAAMAHADSGHVILNETDLKWGDAPPSLPKGAKMAVLEGDPSKEGEFTLRAMFPANYKIAPHWHPTTENVTILKGSMYLGTGEKFDENKATMMKAGGFATIPATHHHYAFTKGECIIEVHAMGPFVINYINPADDPSKK